VAVLPAATETVAACDSKTHSSDDEDPVVVPDMTTLVPGSAFSVTVPPPPYAVVWTPSSEYLSVNSFVGEMGLD
jgi:hypothetical protein